MKKEIIFLMWLLYPLLSSAQKQLIRNGNFESGNKPVNGCITVSADNWAGFNGVDYWRLAWEQPNALPFKRLTADWYDRTICANEPFFLNNAPPPSIGNNSTRWVGMLTNSNGSKEGVRIALSENLIPGQICKLKMRMAVGGNWGVNQDVKLKITFAKWGEHWNSGTGILGGNVKWSDPTDAFHIPQGSPHQWYTKEWDFRVPEQVEGGNADELGNLIIQAGEAASYYYVFIDDVSLIQVDPCTNVCAPSLPNITHGTLTNVCDPLRVVLNANGKEVSQRFHVLIKDATEIEFKVFGGIGWGQILYTYQHYNPNGIKNDGYDDYLLEYFGITDEGGLLPVGVYAYELIIKNCHDFVVHASDLTILSVYPHENPERWNLDIFDCCQDSVFHQNQTFDSVHVSSADIYLTAGRNVTTGPSGDVVITAGAEVDFLAPEVELQDGFIVENGAEFEVSPIACSVNGVFGKRGRITRLTPDKVQTVPNRTIAEWRAQAWGPTTGQPWQVRPNPSQGQLMLEGTGSGYYELEVFNATGIKVYHHSGLDASKAQAVDLSFLPRGMYMLKRSDQVSVQKIILQ